MIERLKLCRWRAFEAVNIDFEQGTTFLVAPNGVGKTSLLLGLKWALFGEAANVDAKSCVRLGHDHAEATVILAVDGQHLTVRRTVTTAGKTTVHFSADSESLATPEGAEVLAGLLGAPLDIAARVAVIQGEGREDGELRLDEHLYDAFGVSGLRRSAAAASTLHKQAEAARKKLRTASRAQLDNRSQLSAEADELRRKLSVLKERRSTLADAVTAAQNAGQAATMWSAYDETIAARGDEVRRVLASASERGLQAGTVAELAASLALAMETNRESTERTRTTYSEAQVQALAARSALSLLEGHDPSCPTCARPFHGDELDRAVAAQNVSLVVAEERIEAVRGELDRLADELQQLNELVGRVALLDEPIAEPASPRPDGDPDTALTAAQEALQSHDELAGSVDGRLAELVAQLSDDDEVQAANRAEHTAWLREALAKAAADALNGTAERLANDYIGPLSQQVRWRWKALFGEDGLQLRPDGTIVRVVGERELAWKDLSSGEQIWARLVASLLVLRSSTKLPFAWLDEPLEHLDPRARRIVATDIATSTQSGRPAQLIVTTYEHPLARQLADDIPGTHIRYINRSGS